MFYVPKPLGKFRWTKWGPLLHHALSRPRVRESVYAEKTQREAVGSTGAVDRDTCAYRHGFDVRLVRTVAGVDLDRLAAGNRRLPG